MQFKKNLYIYKLEEFIKCSEVNDSIYTFYTTIFLVVFSKWKKSIIYNKGNTSVSIYQFNLNSITFLKLYIIIMLLSFNTQEIFQFST